MHKEMFILKGHPTEDHASFKQRMFDLIADVSQQYNPKSLKITLTETPPPRFSVIPFRNEKVAVMSITRETSEELNGIYQAKGFLGGFLVEEAVPVAYKKVWENKTPTPGICLLTLFHRKPTIGEGTFIQRWHEGHTPLSLRLHPLWNYNRNVVKQKLTDGPVWYDGIVEEQFKTRRKLLNPMHFFGPWWKVPYHMLLVYKDTISFIDMKRLETYLATEYHFKT